MYLNNKKMLHKIKTIIKVDHIKNTHTHYIYKNL
jgi:hypothetical protein